MSKNKAAPCINYLVCISVTLSNGYSRDVIQFEQKYSQNASFMVLDGDKGV